MHALSLKQPWATLLIHGMKTIEVRRWSTPRRESILIHAAKVPDEREEAWIHVPPHLQELTTLRGGFIGRANLIECRRYDNLERFNEDQDLHRNAPEWFEKPPLFGFVFTDMLELPFTEFSGWMRFFPVPEEILQALGLEES